MAHPTHGSFSRPRVLVVDDDELVLAAVSRVLEKGDYEPVCCSRASDALELLTAMQPVACVIDLHMPDGRGDDLVDSVRRLAPDLPCILMTADHDHGVQPAAGLSVIRKNGTLGADLLDALGRTASGEREGPSRVMVIDDDPITLEVVRERLEGAGYVVTTREQSLGTAEAVLSFEPHLVLLDVMMPALSGDHLAKLLTRRFGDRLSVILHSSKDSAELRGLVEASGAVGAIVKTSDGEHFLSQFHSLAQRGSRAP